MKIAARVSNIGAYYFAKKLSEIAIKSTQGIKIDNLGIGSPDLFPHISVIEEVSKALLQKEVNIHNYASYSGESALIQSIRSYYHSIYEVKLDQNIDILPVIGSKEGIVSICMSLLDVGDNAWFPNPGYSTYERAISIAGATPIPYLLNEKDEWQIDINYFNELMQLHGKPKLIWLNYPHMPTGVQPNSNKLQALVDWANYHDVIICNDNPYSTILTKERFSIFKLQNTFTNVLELNSLSKSHNMAGWRIGMLIGNKCIVNAIKTYKSNVDSGIFKAIQLGAVKALSLEKSWYDTLNDEYLKRQKIGYLIFDKLECTYSLKQSGLFLWGKIPNSFNSSESYCDYLFEKFEIFIVPGNVFGSNGEGYIRLSLCSSQDVLNHVLTKIKKSHAK